MIDWNKVADAVRWAAHDTASGPEQDKLFESMRLCERMAKGELVECSETQE